MLDLFEEQQGDYYGWNATNNGRAGDGGNVGPHNYVKDFGFYSSERGSHWKILSESGTVWILT